MYTVLLISPSARAMTLLRHGATTRGERRVRAFMVAIEGIRKKEKNKLGRRMEAEV